ncbi:hypothetical protein ANTQUA_LOCUS7895 [Anthophora quadrimaculata]
MHSFLVYFLYSSIVPFNPTALKYYHNTMNINIIIQHRCLKNLNDVELLVCIVPKIYYKHAEEAEEDRWTIYR